MLRRLVSCVTLLCCITCVHGCYSKRLISREELERRPNDTILSIVTIDGEIIEFGVGAAVRQGALEDEVIVGRARDGTRKSIPLSEVAAVEVLD